MSPKTHALLAIGAVALFMALVHVWRVSNNVEYELRPLREFMRDRGGITK